eukprot:g967.t1
MIGRSECPSHTFSAVTIASGREDYNVRLRVQGPADPQELEVLREKILTALKLKPEDLEFEVQAVPDGSGRRLEELEVTLHFQHLSTQQEPPGADDAQETTHVITTVPPSRATEPMPEPMPEPTPQAKTSSLTVARTTTPPTRPTTRRPTTVEHPATTRAPTTPRSPSASTLTTTFPVLHLQKRGMAKDRQAQVFVVFGFRQVPGSYNYVLDDSFDLSAREAQLAVVEFCKLLRLEKALKVVPGVGNCWPEKMKMYMNMRHLPWPTYNFFPALQRFVRESEKWVGEHVGMDAGLEHSMEATRKGVTDASGTTLVVGTPSTHYWTLSGNPQKGTSQWVSDAMKKGGRYLRRVVSTLDVVSIVM